MSTEGMANGQSQMAEVNARVLQVVKSASPLRTEMRAGYAGQRYECRCQDGKGGEVCLGWVDRKDGGAFKRMVERHPRWHSLNVVLVTPERKRELEAAR